MYKDKDRQREANRQIQAKRRAKGVTKGVTSQGVTVSGSGTCVTPKRGKDIKVFADLPPDVQASIRRVSESNEEFKRRTAIAIHYQHVTGRFEPNSDQDFTRLMATCQCTEHQRVSKPGDEDYKPLCETSRRFMEGGGLKKGLTPQGGG